MITPIYICVIIYDNTMIGKEDMITFDRMAIREEIKKAREAKGYSFGELADLCPTISRSDISDYEKGKRNPSLNKLEILSKALEKEWKLK